MMHGSTVTYSVVSLRGSGSGLYPVLLSGRSLHDAASASRISSIASSSACRVAFGSRIMGQVVRSVEQGS